MMTRVAAAVMLVGTVLCGGAQAADKAMKCTMKFNLSGWSAFYKTAKGTGTITCDNGQSARVNLSTKGGGFTVGKSKITDGNGTFSEVWNIEELFGAYATATASAGAAKAADAQALTKGDVSLAITGTGHGWDVGISFGEFRISRRK